MRVRRLSLGLSIVLLTLGSIGMAIAHNPIEMFLCAELVTISTFYIFFTVIIPATRPLKVNPETIFLGGVARTPYISATELYAPGIPFIKETFDDAWDLYFDRRKVRIKFEVENRS
ncbi:MAG: hypothetical protein QXI59_05795 [Candidatus Bathyarchaeia archaeon]